jgi:DNA-binding MarR family transcriptional regulator|tara:strand:+ start:388 stop:804 length:417 start_codon:yes stop_codon:yes gene_type:complete
MRTIADILSGRDMTVDEFMVLNRFWSRIRKIQRRRDTILTKNRELVGVALGQRRVHQKEVDIETLVSLTGLGRSSLQKTLRSMEKDDLIELYRDQADRRRTLVKPTQRYTDLSLDMYEETRMLIHETLTQLESLRREK